MLVASEFRRRRGKCCISLWFCWRDTKLLLWDLEMDELVVPVRHAPGGSPTLSTGNQSFHWDNTSPVGVSQPAPLMRDVPTLSPLVTHRADSEPLSGLIFTPESVLTVSQEGHIKFWTRPNSTESQSSICNPFTSMSVKEKPLTSEKVVDSGCK